MKFQLFSTLFALLSSCATYQHSRLQSGPYQPDHIASIADMTRSVVSKESVRKSFILGIGRSPTPLLASIAGLNEKAGQSLKADSVPLSSFKPKADLTLPEVKKLFQHLDTFFGNKYLNEAFRTQFPFNAVTVVDYANTGEGLANALRYLRYYINSKGIKIRINYLAIYSQDQTSTQALAELISKEYRKPFPQAIGASEADSAFVKKMNTNVSKFSPLGTDFADASVYKFSDGRDLGDLFFGEHFKDASPYGSWNLKTSPIYPTAPDKSPSFGVLSSQVAESFCQ